MLKMYELLPVPLVPKWWPNAHMYSLLPLQWSYAKMYNLLLLWSRKWCPICRW